MLDEAIVLKRHHRRRVARVCMYALLTVTGVILSFSPSMLVTDQVGGKVAIVFSVGLVISSLGCLFGSLTDRWIGEYGFLPLLFSVLAFYGGLAVHGWDHNWPLLAFGFLILGFSCSKIARWQDVRDIKRSSGEYRGE